MSLTINRNYLNYVEMEIITRKGFFCSILAREKIAGKQASNNKRLYEQPFWACEQRARRHKDKQ
jgi:hypothetical protein